MSQELATDVLALFATRIDAITSESVSAGFTASPYRLTLGQEPDSAIDGMYFVRMDSMVPHQRSYGAGENIWVGQVTVELGYFRGGGDMAGGDRQTVMRNASDDSMRVADFVENPAYYDGSNTGVQEIRFQGASRVLDAAHKEVWAVQFYVRWRSDVITS